MPTSPNELLDELFLRDRVLVHPAKTAAAHHRGSTMRLALPVENL